jgi:hypothetical protein
MAVFTIRIERSASTEAARKRRLTRGRAVAAVTAAAA